LNEGGAALGAGGPAISSARRTLSLVLVAMVFVMDGYDLNAMPLAVPRLQDALGLEPAAFGWVFSVVLVGLGAGAALLAPLGDRIGRRPLIVFGCLAVSVATLATATADSIPEFLLWRLVTGVGLGACLPNCTALSAELAPERLRATLMSLVSAGIVVGALAAGMSAPFVVGVGGWQGLFVVPGLFAGVLALLLWWTLSPAGRSAEASPSAPLPPGTRARLPQLELLAKPWRLPFAVVAAALTLNAANLYLLTSWVPTVLPQAGFSVDQASQVAGLMQGAGLALGMLMSLLIDRWRPGPTMVGAFLFMAACFLAIGLTAPDPLRWTLLLLAGAGCVSGAGMALPALMAYLFPSRLLSSGVGMGVLVARVGAISGPLLGTAMLGAGVEPRLFLAAAAVPAAVAALICLALPAALAVKKREEGLRNG
jgi:AAHS family 4-hydroxybenzoate transporter-like MFS transporter